MSRVNDVGGMHGFGSIDVADDAPGFHHEWEARVFVLNRALMQAGYYTLDEFRHAVERMDPAEYLESSYYERWRQAIEMLLREKGVLDAV